jgi:hypothetical protein
MKRSGSKDQNGRGWLAASIAGFSGAAAIVTVPASTGDWTIGLLAATAVSVICTLVGIQGERKQNGGLSLLTLVIVGIFAVLGAAPAWVEGITWPQVLPISAAILGVIFTVAARMRGDKPKSNWDSESGWM